MGLKISSGKIPRAQKVVLYGVEGIGKTTLAAKTPDPLFIDTEGGTAHMDVKRIDGIGSWEQLIATVEEVAETPGVCKTLVIDTADWAEKVCIEYLFEKNNWTSIETPGYGKGYVAIREEFIRLLDACDKVIAAGINVVITAHAKVNKVELPDEMTAYDRWELKLTKQTAPLLKEWPDALLFANYKTLVVTTGDGPNKTGKGTGGKRVIYTTHKPAYDAKNRHGLPDEVEMRFSNIKSIFNDNPVVMELPKREPNAPAQTVEPPAEPIKEETLETITQMMDEAGIRAEEVQGVVAKKSGKFAAETPISEYSEKFAQNWLIKNWQRVVDTIENDPNHVPF